MFGIHPYTIAGIGAAFVLLFGYAQWEHAGAKSARAKTTVAINNERIVLEANASNQATIKSLLETIEHWKKLATPSDEMKKAAARAGELEQQVQALSDELGKQAEKDNAKPDCVKLLDADFERVCSVTAHGLRERASRYENRNQGSAGAGGREDRPLFD